MSILEKETRSRPTSARYAKCWRTFETWCAESGATSMPSTPSLLCNYLRHRLRQGKKMSTISVDFSAIRAKHVDEYDGLCPTYDIAVRRLMDAAHGKFDEAPRKKDAIDADGIVAMSAACGGGIIGKRDRALLLLGFAPSRGRSSVDGGALLRASHAPRRFRASSAGRE